MLMLVGPRDAGLRTAVGRAAGSRPGATPCEPVRGPEALYTAHPRGSPAMRREIRWNHERGVRVRVRGDYRVEGVGFLNGIFYRKELPVACQVCTSSFVLEVVHDSQCLPIKSPIYLESS